MLKKRAINRNFGIYSTFQAEHPKYHSSIAKIRSMIYFANTKFIIYDQLNSLERFYGQFYIMGQY